MPRKIAFYTEVPTTYLDLLTPYIDGHFCIATECLKDPAYFEWYINRPKGVKVFLDNGMFEEGRPLPPQDLLDIADAIKPDLVFAPDQVGDRAKTIQMTERFIDLNNGQYKVAAIPQGADAEDVVRCYNDMTWWNAIHTVGISFLNDRKRVVDLLNLRDEWCAKPHHFLGMYDIADFATWPKCVTSMDTIKPFKAAYHYHKLNVCPRGLGKWNTDMKLDHFNQLTLLFQNIASIHKELTYE